MAKSKAAPHKVKLTDWGIQSLEPAAAGKRYMVWGTATQHLAVLALRTCRPRGFCCRPTGAVRR